LARIAYQRDGNLALQQPFDQIQIKAGQILDFVDVELVVHRRQSRHDLALGQLIAAHSEIGRSVRIHPVARQVVARHLGAWGAVVGDTFYEQDGLDARLRAKRSLVRANALAQQKAIPAVQGDMRGDRACVGLKRAPDLFQVFQRVGDNRDAAPRSLQGLPDQQRGLARAGCREQDPVR